MSAFRTSCALVVVAVIPFLLTYAKSKRTLDDIGRVAEPATSAGVSDSAQLARIGLSSGRELIAYVYSGSGCGTCRSPELKTLIGSLRDSLKSAHSRNFQTVKVVGVAIDGDVETGLRYLSGIGMESFDEISVGSGWQNQVVVETIWRQHRSEAGAPFVILVAREVHAQLDPLSLRYGPDSVLKVLKGVHQLAQWMSGGQQFAQAAK